MSAASECEQPRKKPISARFPEVFYVYRQPKYELFDTVLEKSELLRLRFKAIRCGAWFRALSRLDRAVVDMTLRVVDGVRSLKLAAAVLSVVRKLEESVEGGVSRFLKEVGFQFALKLSLFAQKGGNVHARDWASDASFAKFLVIMHINDSKMLTP